MKTQEWNPGFTPEGGYPYSEPKSRELLADKYRLHPHQSVDGRIVMDINDEAYPGIKMTEEKSETEDFLIFRLFEYSEALNIAEGQILDILHEDPFIPESMNFEVAFKNSDIREAPVKIYINKTDQNILLFRNPGSPMEEGYNPSMYTLQMKKDDGSILSVDLILSSKRIAYTALWSLGVPVKSTIEFNPEIVAEEVKSDANYEVIYRFSDSLSGYDIERKYALNSNSEENAISAARNLLIEEYGDTDNFELKALLEPALSRDSERWNFTVRKLNDNANYHVCYKYEDSSTKIGIESYYNVFADSEYSAIGAAIIQMNKEFNDNTPKKPEDFNGVFVVTKLNDDSAIKAALTQIQNSKPIGITEEEIDDVAFAASHIESAKNKKALDEEYLSRQPKLKCSHRVLFKRPHGKGTMRFTVDVNADDDSDALTKAKFIIETEDVHNVGTVEFNELSIVE